MRYKTAAVFLGLSLLVPIVSSADTLSDLQAQLAALTAQLKSLTDAQQGNNSQGNSQGNAGQSNENQGNSGNGNSNPGKAPALCVDLKHTLSLDDEDATTDGEITKLQKFLAAHGASIYPEARITGYFGPATMRAVQRWQAKSNVVSSGDPDTTGYGYVGTKTRLAMGCTSVPPTGATSTPPVVVTPPTPTATTTPPTQTTPLPPPTSVSQPAIISLTADPREIKSVKDTVLISWRTQNFKSCSLIYSVYQRYGLGYSSVKVLATSYTDTGALVVSPATIVEGTDNPAYMATFVTLVCRDRYGGEKRAVVRFGPGYGYTDWDSLPNPWANAQPTTDGTPIVQPPVTQTPTTTTTTTTQTGAGATGAPTCSVSTSASTVSQGGTYTVTWTSTNTSYMTGLVGDEWQLGSSGSYQMTTGAPGVVTNTLTFHGNNPTLSATCTYSVTVTSAEGTINGGTVYTATPTITGTAAAAPGLTFAIDSLVGTRMYTSGPLTVSGGAWSVTVPTPLAHGIYRLYLYNGTTQIANASLVVDLNPHAWFVTPSGTTFTSANPSFSGTSTNMTTLEYGYVATNAPGGIEDAQIVGTVPVTNNTWNFTLNRTFTNGGWVAMTFIPSTHQPLSSIGFTMNLPIPVVLGTYVGYRNGSVFNTTENISQDDALANCQLNATNNPSAKYRCFWNTTQIFDNSGVICPTVSQTSCSTGYTQSGGGMDVNNCQVAISCVAISNWSTVTITPNKTTYVGGETSSYTWSVATTAPSTPAFALTIVPSGMTMPNSAWPQPVNPYISMNGAKTGSNTLLIPWTAGSYDFLVYTVSGNVEVARGPLLTVTQPSLPSAACPVGVTCPNFWVRPGHGPAVCQKYTSQQSYAVVDTRVENCSGTFCVSPAFLYATQAGNVISDFRQADLPADKTLHKVRCNAACTDAAGCAANSVASASQDVRINNLASALAALQTALAELMRLMGR